MYLLQGRVPNPRKCFCVRQGPCTPSRVRCSAVSACPRSLCKRQGYVEPGEGRVPTQCSGGQPAAACLGSHACILQYHPSQATRWLGSARSRAIAAARPQGSTLSWCSGAKASGAEWTWPGMGTSGCLFGHTVIKGVAFATLSHQLRCYDGVHAILAEACKLHVDTPAVCRLLSE